MQQVKAKKFLGQHFLKDQNIARNIVASLTEVYPKGDVLEVGPGMGVLTQFLLAEPTLTVWAVEVDMESVSYLNIKFPQLSSRLLMKSFLDINFEEYFQSEFSVIGNFPYYLSSQIVFNIIDNKIKVPFMVGMFQKEVAQRLCSLHGSKAYGILSVVTQAFYEVEYLFTVSETVFDPPPKVKSAVVRFSRKNVPLGCDEKLFRTVVKVAFNQRRKKLRNSISSYGLTDEQLAEYASKRAEELSVNDFVNLTLLIASTR
ncbi:MAG: 16S rRNA (adenine(1518)-N(6)/adenine(1519)-N(6))-dimethyltransferase RsmA [Bacteroidia bacterium]|nr:16S rRNA (adenine(1518)-N(6)/adenine(1519)-N(6))-dimethyltransferase RsmA [Bacteroidia bacterium]